MWEREVPVLNPKAAMLYLRNRVSVTGFFLHSTKTADCFRHVCSLSPLLVGLLGVTELLYTHVFHKHVYFGNETAKDVFFERGDKSTSMINVSRDVVCGPEILPPDSFHIVIAGWEYVPNFEDHFLWVTGLSNAHIFLYRRTEELKLPRRWTGACGMEATELLLFPNKGFEASAFLDYMTLYHDNPPLAMVFLHGHVANSWHTSCEAILSRISFYYAGLSRDPAHTPDMITLTSKSDKSFDGLDWFGGRKLESAQTKSHDDLVGTTLAACRDLVTQIEQATQLTDLVPQVESGAQRPYFSSCCANFILRGTRYRQVPLHVIHAMRDFAVNASYDSKIVATHCFEFLVHSLYANPDNSVTFLGDWYKSAAGHMNTVVSSTRAFAKCKMI